MASTVFVQLYQQASRREHAKVVQVQVLVGTAGITDLLAATRLAGELQQLGASIDDQIMATARSNRMRVRKIRYRCPVCQQPDCLLAQPLSFMGQVTAYKLHLLQGGEPYEFLD